MRFEFGRLDDVAEEFLQAASSSCGSQRRMSLKCRIGCCG
jgi:hypothetical protein